MIIGVDLDEILSDTLTSVLEFYNKLHGTSIKRDSFHTYNYWEIWGGTREKAIELMDQFYDTDGFLNIMPVYGAFEALTKLKKLGFEFCIVTGRSKNFEKETKEWIDINYPNIFSEIYFANTFSIDNSDQRKSAILKKLGIKTFIEDDPYHITDCLNMGIKVFTIDYPWNKGLEDKNLIRVKSWSEILKRLPKEAI